MAGIKNIYSYCHVWRYTCCQYQPDILDTCWLVVCLFDFQCVLVVVCKQWSKNVMIMGTFLITITPSFLDSPKTGCYLTIVLAWSCLLVVSIISFQCQGLQECKSCSKSQECESSSKRFRTHPHQSLRLSPVTTRFLHFSTCVPQTLWCIISGEHNQTSSKGCTGRVGVIVCATFPLDTWWGCWSLWCWFVWWSHPLQWEILWKQQMLRRGCLVFASGFYKTRKQTTQGLNKSLEALRHYSTKKL